MRKVTLISIGIIAVSIIAISCVSAPKHRMYHQTIQEKNDVMKQRANAMIRLIESDPSLPRIETRYDDNAGVSWEQYVFQEKNITIAYVSIVDSKNNLRLQLSSNKKTGEDHPIHLLNVLN